jgi:peroxiredoxin
VTKNIFKIGLAVFLISSLVNITYAMSQVPQNVDIVGQRASGFTLEDTQGKKIDVAKFIGTKPLIFFFWTTWCPHCREQIKHLKNEADNIKKSGAELFLIDVDENRAQVNKFLKNFGYFDSLLDEDSKIAERDRKSVV